MNEDVIKNYTPLNLLSKALKHYAYGCLLATVSSTVGLLAVILSAFYGNEELFILSSLLVIVMLIASVVFYFSACLKGKQENEGFKKAFSLYLINIALLVINYFIQGSVINILYSIASSVINVLSIYFIITSVNGELNNRNQSDLAKIGVKVLIISVVYTIIINPFMEYYSSGVADVDTAGLIVSIVSLVISVAIIIYQAAYFLKASKVVGE